MSWNAIPLSPIAAESVRAPETSKQGPIDLDLLGGKLKYRLGGVRIEGNRLTADQVSVELSYEEIKGKNVLIIDIPEITVRTVRKEKNVFGRKVVYDEPVTETKTRQERKETPLFTFHNPGIIAEKKKDASLGLSLPTSLLVKISATPKGNRVEFPSRAEIVTSLHQAIDAGLADERLAPAVEYRLVNVPSEIQPLLKGKIDSEKPAIYQGLRAALKDEVAKPEFLDDLQSALAKELPPLALAPDQILEGNLRLSDKPLVPSGLDVGEIAPKACSRFDQASAPLRVAANLSGLNVMLKSFLNGLANEKFGNEELASVVGALLEENFDAKDVDSVGIDKHGQHGIRFGTQGRILVDLGLVVNPRNGAVEPRPFRLTLNLSLDANGSVQLDRMQSPDTGGKVSAGTLFGSVANGVKVQMARMVLNEKLQKIQAAGQANQGLFVELLKGSNPEESVLVFQLR